MTKGICEAIIPISKGINDGNAMAYDHKTDMALIVVGGGMFSVGSSVLGTTAVGLGMINYAATASASSRDLLRSRTSAPFRNKDKTIIVNFEGHALKRK